MRKKPDNNYLHFTKKERNGIVMLLIILLLIITVPLLYSYYFKPATIKDNRYAADLSRLKLLSTESETKKSTYLYKMHPAKSSYTEKNTKTELFYFDPNLLAASGWSRLGVKEKTIATIQNYISKGGRFREATDIKKIWGLAYMADKLMPYVRIEQPEKNSAFENNYKSGYKKKEYHPIDINVADSTAFMALPGIGPGLSNRIIKYRDKLGGFYSPGQVAETFGLPDSTYRKIKPSLITGENPVKKININTATADELKAHPYIRYHLANAMVEYRMQHGNYNAVSDIRHIMLINDSIFNRIAPYLDIR